MNYDVYRSMDALEAARRIESENFLAQFKYAELYYRIRALDRAEAETTRALELAGTSWELSLARRQLSEIRRLRREGPRKPTCSTHLQLPFIDFAFLLPPTSCFFLLLTLNT